jgi:membrane fusion protein (multidrug efflux system)
MSVERANAPSFKLDWSASAEVLWRSLALVVAAAILLIVVTRWDRWQGAAGWQSTDDAYLQADLTPLAAKVPGYVREVPVEDFQRVHAGQLVALIVDDDYRAALAQAQANLCAATAKVRTLKAQRSLQAANVQAANDVVAATSATLEQSDRDVVRQHRLFATGSSSIETAEKLETAQAELSAQLNENRARATAAERQLAVLTAQQTQAEAAAAAQAATVDTARINLGYTRIVAPQNGVLGQRQVQVGQFVGAGGQIDTLTPLPHVWVVANFKETQLTHMAVGERAQVLVDTFPGRVLRGHVVALAPGSGAEFALLPPDNATGNFTKVVQRIAVKIAIDDAGDLAGNLRPGMSVVARVDARHEVGR